MSNWPSWRRIALNGLTLVAALLASVILLGSWFQPSPQTQLDLFQVDLALQASRTLDNPDYQDLARPLLGDDVFNQATQRYQKTIENLEARLQQMQERSESSPPPQLAADELTGLDSQDPARVAQTTKLTAELDGIRLSAGVLQAYQDQVEAALGQWDAISTDRYRETTAVLEGLWGTPRRILPEAEMKLREGLEGWFEATALQRLLGLQQRADALNTLTQSQEQAAISALLKLALVGGVPLVGILLGSVILVIWLVWNLWQKQGLVGSVWQVPWQGVEVQGVLTGWFFSFLILGWVVPQVYTSALRLNAEELNYWQQAMSLLLTYVSEALVGLGLIYTAVRQYRPLDSDLFRVRLFDGWLLWGLGGYGVAMPVVLVASALSQWLLPESGGGNPILPIIWESQGWAPRILFLIVVSVCAPIFEEILFRGFVFPYLSRVMPMGSALVISGLLFATAHLNFSDLLPLTVLGIVLGISYSHSRNLLTPILLHSFWNGGTLLTLLVLGGQA